MLRHRYKLMRSSEEKSSKEQAFPDVLTYPLKQFRTSSKPKEHVLSKSDIERFDLLVYRYYRMADYDDFILWYNGIGDVRSLEPGDILTFPSKTDIERFYSRGSTRRL